MTDTTNAMMEREAENIARQVATSGKTGRIHATAYEPAKAAALVAFRAGLEAAVQSPSIVGVRALEWTLEDDDWWGASALGLVWEVRQARASVRARFPDSRQFEVFDGTLDAAKAAAQADYERRILSSLAPVEAPPLASVEGVGAWRDVIAERQRQVEAEGWTPEHDDWHSDYEMVLAAVTYLLAASADQAERAVMDDFRDTSATPASIMQFWPWDRKWWKPTNRRRDLVKAGALILAEIERLDRKEASNG